MIAEYWWHRARNYLGYLGSIEDFAKTNLEPRDRFYSLKLLEEHPSLGPLIRAIDIGEAITFVIPLETFDPGLSELLYLVAKYLPLNVTASLLIGEFVRDGDLIRGIIDSGRFEKLAQFSREADLGDDFRFFMAIGAVCSGRLDLADWVYPEPSQNELNILLVAATGCHRDTRELINRGAEIDLTVAELIVNLITFYGEGFTARVLESISDSEIRYIHTILRRGSPFMFSALITAVNCRVEDIMRLFSENKSVDLKPYLEILLERGLLDHWQGFKIGRELEDSRMIDFFRPLGDIPYAITPAWLGRYYIPRMMR